MRCFLHTGESSTKTLPDDLTVKIFTDCEFDELKISAVVSDTSGNLNEFGDLFDELKIMHIYCTDHVLQLIAKRYFMNIKMMMKVMTI